MLENAINDFQIVRITDEHRTTLQRHGIQQFECLNSVDSTNTWAANALRNHQQETTGKNRDQPSTLQLPALILALEQTAGRGQRGKSWQAGQGSLAFSLVVRFDHPQPLLGIATALAIAEGIETATQQQVRTEIKWPNDLVTNNGKLGGILIEQIATPANVNFNSAHVIGVGLNVNNQPAQLGSALMPPVSMSQIANQSFSLSETFCTIIQRIMEYLGQLKESENNGQGDSSDGDSVANSIIRQCQQRFWLANKRVTIETPNGSFSGPCVGLDNSGQLILELSGSETTFSSGHIQLVETI